MLKWIIYYEDGSEFTSDDGGPEDAPRQGVAVIAQADEQVGRKLRWNQDAYCWEYDQWVPHDRYSVERYIDKTIWPIRLVGYWLPDERFWRLYKKALNDPRLPPKNALSPLDQGSPNEWGRYGNERE